MSLTLAAIVILSAWVIGIVAAGLVMALRPGGIGVRFKSAGTPSAATGPRDEIPLGGEAEVLGNVRGRVRAVEVNPETRRLEAIRLAKGMEDEEVPASAVVSADGQVVRLAEGWPEISPDGSGSSAASLRDGVAVVSGDAKPLGRLRLVCFDPGSRIVTALVIAGRRGAGSRLVPFERVTEAGPDRIVTNLPAAELAGLQPFATDWEIREGILAALSLDPALRPLQRSLRIDVVDQQVRVGGYVTGQAQVDRVERAVRTLPEVLQLDLDLVTDDDLAGAVTAAITRDPATAAARVQVMARSGIVDITGEVPDRAAARRIEAVARQVAGVQAVHNMVAIQPAATAAS